MFCFDYFSIQGREPYLLDLIFLKKALNSSLLSDIYRLIFSNFFMMRETTQLYILMCGSMTLSFLQGHSFMTNPKHLLTFSRNFFSVWMKLSKEPLSACLLKVLLHLFCTINIQERKLCLCKFGKYTLNTGICLDTCELICFTFDGMLDTSKLYSFNDLDLCSWSQGYGNTRTHAIILL